MGVETRRALCVFGLCGLASVLVDVDHVIALFLWKTGLPGITEGRILHTPVFIMACIGICCMVSRLRGLYSKLVLGAVLLTTILVLTLSPQVVWGWTV